MVVNFFNIFKLVDEQEQYESVVGTIDKGVVFRGTNLWVLVFAIFIASLGLNMNSTAVIIGAMLISPLMGPIMGIGLGAGINDLTLLRKSFQNYLFAVLVSLAASTLYFFLSPISDVHSELLARTSPTIYDVLIALFGGFAGILATLSKQKGNVIPGVAIATALMPPLCTAGYGLASHQWGFFFGAFYLFFINSVFIGLATLLTVRIFKFPYKHQPNQKAEKRSQRIVAVLLVLTLVPSTYFGYEIVLQQRFLKTANDFIEKEGALPNDYLLSKHIDAKNKLIILTYGGKEISKGEIDTLKSKLPQYLPKGAELQIHQGFAYLKNKTENTQANRLSLELSAKEIELTSLKEKLDSIKQQDETGKQIFAELKVNYPDLKNAAIHQALLVSDSTAAEKIIIAEFSFSKPVKIPDKEKIRNWLKVRLKQDNIMVSFD